jgi:hypothetical protein
MVKETAVAMAHELYDHMMQDNGWWQAWRSQWPGLTGPQLEEKFVARNLAALVPQARAALAGMLRTTADETVKESIYEALVLDATLIRGRAN